jgi:phage shock protein A
MANFMKQLTSIFKAGVESLMEPADDPRKTYSDPGQRQQELLSRVREALLQNTHLRKRLQQRIAGLQTKIPQLQATAKQAVATGHDDMARMALQQRQLALMELKTLEASANEVWLEEQRITIVEQRLTAQVDAMRIRQEMTAARYTAAESQAIVHEVLNDFSKELSDLGQSIELTEQKTEHLQARANAFEEFVDFATLDLSNGTTNDPVARQLIQLDIDSAVGEQLAELKKQLKV